MNGRRGAQTFPSGARLKSANQIRALFRRGRRFRDGAIEYIYRFHPDASTAAGGASRLGAQVPKRARSAVERSRLKRIAREIFRKNRAELDSVAPVDVFVRFIKPERSERSARERAGDRYAAIEASFERFKKRLARAGRGPGRARRVEKNGQ